MSAAAPKSTIAALALAVGASLIRGLLGTSVAAGVVIAIVIAILGARALKSSRKSMNRFAIGLAIYGGAFAVQAVALNSYVGVRSVDILWGLLLVCVGIFLWQSKTLSLYFAQTAQVKDGENVANRGEGR